MDVVVRVVETAERRIVGWLVAVPMGLVTAAILLEVIEAEAIFGDPYWGFGLACAAWSLGLLLTRRPPPRVTRATTDALGLHLGESWLSRHRALWPVTAVNAARAERGYSVAVGRGAGPSYFLEVEREADARTLVERLAAQNPGAATVGAIVPMTMPHLLLRAVRWGLGLSGMICASLYAVFVAGMDAPEFKFFGLLAIVLALCASVVFVVEPLFRRTVRIGEESLAGKSAVARHTRVHVRAALADKRGEDGIAFTESGDARSKILDRTDEARSAWAARLDALTTGGEGYRDNAFSLEELRKVAEDEHASVDARLGALRVLARSPAARGLPELRERVAEQVGARRVRVVIESETAEDVVEALDAIGPVFRMLD